MAEVTERKKRSVLDVKGFVGMGRIMEIIEKAETRWGLEKAALVATLFEGGFRVSEAVASPKTMTGLQANQITMNTAKGTLTFNNVTVLKKYNKKKGSTWECDGAKETCKNPNFWEGKGKHKHWKTERIATSYRTTPVPLW